MDSQKFDRNELIELYENCNYEKLMNNLSCGRNNDKILTVKEKATYNLLLWIIIYSDVEFMDKIFADNNYEDLFSLKTYSRLLEHIIDKNRKDLLEYYLNNFKVEAIDNLIISIIHSNKIELLPCILNHGYKLDNRHIEYAIDNYGFELIIYAYINGYNVQESFNKSNLFYQEKYDNNEYQNGTWQIDEFRKLILTLIKCEINITTKIDNLFYYGSQIDDIETIKYFIQNYNIDNEIMNESLKICCRNNSFNVAEYILHYGTTIIINDELKSIPLDTIIVLLRNGIQIDKNIISIALAKCFVDKQNLTDICFLLECGADIDYIFNETQFNIIKKRNNEYYYVSTKIIYPIDYIISNGYVNCIKFLYESCSNKLEINKLLVLSISHGQLDMANYLISIGADSHFDNDIALIYACYFGHADCVKILLDTEIDFGNLPHSLFKIALFGFIKSFHNCDFNNIFQKIRNSDIFRSYHYKYGKHAEVFDLLVDYKVHPPKYTIFMYKADCFFITNKCIEYFVSCGMELNKLFKIIDFPMEDNIAYTSILELYVCSKNIPVVKLLLDAGADVNINNNGVITIAKENNDIEMIKLFTEYAII